MKTVNSISGGKTSAFLAAHFPADYDVFALVRTNDPDCMFPDKKLRQLVSDKIGMEFIGTLEDDMIIYTMLDLEQYIGREITWLSSPLSYEELIEKKKRYLPNKVGSYCTTHLKIEPIFYWWHENISEPIETRIGYRANETGRKESKLAKLNSDGLEEMRATFEKNARDQNKWVQVPWTRPAFPLIDDLPTFRDGIEMYWKDKPVRFAAMNNCVGCFWRSPILLRKMFDAHPNKMNWFLKQETIGQWRTDVSYRQIQKHRPQIEIDFSEFDEGCESGHCGL